MTLKELIEKHGFGVWLAHRKTPNEKMFKPMVYSEKINGKIIGERWDGYADSFYYMVEDLVLYEPPKKKVKLYKYFYSAITSNCSFGKRYYAETNWSSRSFDELKKNRRLAKLISVEEKEKEIEVSE